MANTQFVTAEGAGLRATRLKTALVNSKLRLIKSPNVPTQYSTAEELEAMEADFSGYTPGGYTLAAWTGPANASGGGKVITSPVAVATFDAGDDPLVTNTVNAWWIENATGGIELVGVFDAPVSMALDGDVITFITQDVEGRNPPAE